MSIGASHQQEALCRFREPSTATHCLFSHLLLEQINQLCLGRSNPFSNLEGNLFMMDEHRVSYTNRRTITVSSGCRDDTKEEINAHTRLGQPFFGFITSGHLTFSTEMPVATLVSGRCCGLNIIVTCALTGQTPARL